MSLGLLREGGVEPPGAWKMSRPAVSCRRCGRVLKDEHSILEGIGPTCARKEAVDTFTIDMFDANDYARMNRETAAEAMRAFR